MMVDQSEAVKIDERLHHWAAQTPRQSVAELQVDETASWFTWNVMSNWMWFMASRESIHGLHLIRMWPSAMMPIKHVIALGICRRQKYWNPESEDCD